MSQQNSTKAAVRFCDVAAYFSEEEWNLLHEWQKEIYDNVMKEIQQVLISLGPVIAASVFSLKAKEREEREDVFPAENPVPENNAEHYHRDMSANIYRSFRKPRHANGNSKDILYNDKKASTDYYVKELPSLNCERILQTERKHEQSFIDQLDNGGESGTRKSSAMSPVEFAAVVSFRIKEEREMGSMDHDEHVGNKHKHNTRAFLVGNSEADARVTDPCGADAGESSPRSRSGHAVNLLHASFGQEEKGVTYLMNEQFSESNQHIHICSALPALKCERILQTEIENEQSFMDHLDNGGERGTHKSSGINESRNPPEQQQHAVNWEGMYPHGDSRQKFDFDNPKIIHTFEGKTRESIKPVGVFSKAPKMIKHQKTQKQYGSTEHKEYLNDLNLNQHSGLKQSICSQCGNWFNQSIDMIAHNQLQPQEEQYLCSKCESNICPPIHSNKGLGTQKGQKRFICNVCGRSFKMSQTLLRHQRIHTGERPYTCSDCGKTFRQSDVLVRHRRIHSGVKPYTCPHCKKNFRQKTHLITHQQMHVGKNVH